MLSSPETPLASLPFGPLGEGPTVAVIKGSGDVPCRGVPPPLARQFPGVARSILGVVELGRHRLFLQLFSPYSLYLECPLCPGLGLMLSTACP